MGRATIVGGGTDGLFTVSLDYGVAERNEIIAQKNARIGELTAQIAAQTVMVDAATAAKGLALENLNIAIQALSVAQAADPDGKHAAEQLAVNSATVAARAAAANEAALKVPRDLLKAARKALQKEISNLQSAITSETRQAWCVDLTESASGVVGTVDVPGETTSVLLVPGCAAAGAGDGRMLAREVMSPAQAFYNAAMLPGWQKWMPTYRKATITAINKVFHVADVTIDAATSSAARLGVNQETTLTGVPVRYMTCNAAPFEIGDRVIVKFVGMAQASPMVIGFVDHPKTCELITKEYSVEFFATPDTGCIFAPTVLIQNNMSLSYSQTVRKGQDCDPVSLLNTNVIGNEFNGWSDGNSLATRHDTNVLTNATYVASVIRTPIRIGIDLFIGSNSLGGLVGGISNGLGFGDYDILSYPSTRIWPDLSPPPGYFNFEGESIVIGATAGGSYRTISFIIIIEGGAYLTKRV